MPDRDTKMATGGVQPYITVLQPYEEVCDKSFMDETSGEGTGILHFQLNEKKGEKYIARYDLKPVIFTTHGEVQMDILGGYLNDYIEKLLEKLRNEGNGERPATGDSHSEFIELAKSQAEDLTLYTGKECAYDNILILAIKKDGADTIDFYMLEDGVRLKDTNSDSLAKVFDQSCSVTGSDNTYVVIENDKKFKKYLKPQIVYCKDHIVPAMEAVRTKRHQYSVSGLAYSMYNKHGESYVQVRNNRDMKKIQSYAHYGEKVRGTPQWGKAHINGTGSDSLLIYVRQQYAHFKVVVVVGILDHKEAGLSDYTGSYQARHQEFSEDDVSSEWDKIQTYLDETNARVHESLEK